MGPNAMHPRVLRELPYVIADPLSVIFERSWRTGEVPKDWRKASVTPVFKKGKKEGTTGQSASLPSLESSWSSSLWMSSPGKCKKSRLSRAVEVISRQV